MSASSAVFTILADQGRVDNVILGYDLLKVIIKNAVDAALSGQGEFPTPSDISRTHLIYTHSSFRAFVQTASEYQSLNPATNVGALTASGTAPKLTFNIPQAADFVSDFVLVVDIGAVTDSQKYKLNAANVTRVDPVWKLYKKSPTGSHQLLHTFTPGSLSNATGGSLDIRLTEFLLDFKTPVELAADVQTTGLEMEKVLPWTSDVYTAAVTARDGLVEDVPDGVQVFDGTQPLAGVETGVTNPNSKDYMLVLEYTECWMDGEGSQVPLDTELSAAHAPWLRYCNKPGFRLTKQARILITNSELDKYTSDNLIMDEKLFVPDDKRDVLYKMIGQEVAVDAYGAVSGGVRELKKVVMGPQTPVPGQTAPLSLWIPGKFWFQDLKQALPNLCLPFAQKQIEITCASLSELVYTVSANVFRVDKTVTMEVGRERKVFSKKSLIPKTDYDNQSPKLTTDSTTYKMYLNTLFTYPEMHDIYTKNHHINLIHLHLNQVTDLTTSNQEVQMTDLRFPVEHIAFGFRPKSSNQQGVFAEYNTDPDRWDAFCRKEMVPLARRVDLGLHSGYLDLTDYYWHETPIVDRISVKAHGSEIIPNDREGKFFREYIPWKRGPSVYSPRDPGVMILPFALYLNEFQPSGHINLSRAREFFVRFYSQHIGPSAPFQSVEVIAVSRCLNFLLVTSGTCLLRFAS